MPDAMRAYTEFARLLSCPRCGQNKVVETIIIRSLYTLAVPVKCDACNRESGLTEWLERPVRSLKRVVS